MNTAQSPDLAAIKSLVSDSLQSVDLLIIEKLSQALPIVKSVCHHLTFQGGKRIRPLLLLLISHALSSSKTMAIHLAAIIEILHTATLLHDDVIDHSEQRRSRKTAHLVWNSETSILVGDFLHALSFEMLLDTQSPEIMQTFSQGTKTIVTGELIQITSHIASLPTEAMHLSMIAKKTACLFSTAAKAAALLASQPPKIMTEFESYGLSLGMAYQLIDDYLDFGGSSKTLGKNIGDDIAEGKPTLPVIYAMNHANPSQKDFIQKIIKQRHITPSELEALLTIIDETKALHDTYQIASRYIEKASKILKNLTIDIDTTALNQLAYFVLNRNY